MRLIDNYVKNFVQKDYEIFEPKVLKADSNNIFKEIFEKLKKEIINLTLEVDLNI